jgi:hypothetical protein
MARGKYVSLEEARKDGTLNRFCKEHPLEAERERFLRLLEEMAKGSLEGEGTSAQGASEGSSETRTHRNT